MLLKGSSPDALDVDAQPHPGASSAALINLKNIVILVWQQSSIEQKRAFWEPGVYRSHQWKNQLWLVVCFYAFARSIFSISVMCSDARVKKRPSRQHLMSIWAEQEVCGGAALRKNTQRSQQVNPALTAAFGFELQATQVRMSYICHLTRNPSFHEQNHVYPESGDINCDGSNRVDVFCLPCSKIICLFENRPESAIVEVSRLTKNKNAFGVEMVKNTRTQTNKKSLKMQVWQWSIENIPLMTWRKGEVGTHSQTVCFLNVFCPSESGSDCVSSCSFSRSFCDVFHFGPFK